MARGGAWVSSAAVVLWLMATGAGAVWLEIGSSATKCVSEEIRSNVVVIGDYYTLHENRRARPSVSVKVTSPFGDTIHRREKVFEDQFAFTTAEAGNYLACFSVDGEYKGIVVTLILDWKIGIAAKDWDSVAKREKLEGVELELLKLDSAVQAIHQHMLLLISKEANMRDVSEKTYAKITWLTMMSLGVCIIASFWQLLHLKQYFRKKKII